MDHTFIDALSVIESLINQIAEATVIKSTMNNLNKVAKPFAMRDALLMAALTVPLYF